MQVFLPYPSLAESVRCLDKSRLGNQIWRECKTLLNGGWSNHPVAKMWANYKPALAMYGRYGATELLARRDISLDKYRELITYFDQFLQPDFAGGLIPYPPFIGNEEFHLSHRLNLLWKNPEWYSQYFDEPIPTTKPPYTWPSPQKIGAAMPEQQTTKTM